jgi:hypothetical protein
MVAAYRHCRSPRLAPLIPASIVVHPGVGIPGVAAIGMTVDEVVARVPDAQVRYAPEVRYPWQVVAHSYSTTPHRFQAQSSTTRWPWEKPSNVCVEVPSLGVSFDTRSHAEPIDTMRFWSHFDPSWPIIGSNTWFCGSLSCGISFAGRRRVPRHEVVHHFGEPMVCVSTDAATSEEARRIDARVKGLLGLGTSVATTGRNGVENLHYPTNGIYVTLEGGYVISFGITSPVAPHGLRDGRASGAAHAK